VRLRRVARSRSVSSRTSGDDSDGCARSKRYGQLLRIPLHSADLQDSVPVIQEELGGTLCVIYLVVLR
jgi:hypothetical protein